MSYFDTESGISKAIKPYLSAIKRSQGTDKCKCKKGFGWHEYRCLKCGGDIRGVWYLDSIIK